MLFVSWNVAALSTTLSKIDTDYNNASSKEYNSSLIEQEEEPQDKKKKQKQSRCHAISYFLRKHHDIDIFCIQEHKIPLSQLSSRSEAFGIANNLEGYESFWSCNNTTTKAKRGFNGVVTFAKKGLVKSACCTPLGINELDNQGRVIVTDHGKFVLFNVYAPASCGHSLTDKMRFLNALRRSMKKYREDGKHVILVGDLNISHMANDRFWKFRLVNVNKVIQEVEECSSSSSSSSNNKSDFPLWKMQLASHWNEICSILETKQAIKTNTKNPTTGEIFIKYRVQVNKKGNNNKHITLGGYEVSEEDALNPYTNFTTSDTYFDYDLDKECLCKEENLIYIDTLCELMSKLVNINWDVSTQRLIAEDKKVVGVNNLSPAFEWFNKLLKEDCMIDTFRYYYPTAQGRFTCWNQQLNRRYRNEGTRIDYILIDKSLLPFLCKGSDDDDESSNSNTTKILLNSGLQQKQQHPDPLGEEAALLAATANHNYQPAGFDGGGIMSSSNSPPQHIIDSQFGFCGRHTGIIYTPPTYSDHIAVSAVLKDGCNWMNKNQILNEKDLMTRKTQPHKSQSSIASFLKKSCSNDNTTCKSVKSDIPQTQSVTSSSKIDVVEKVAISADSKDNSSSKRSNHNNECLNNTIQSNKKKKSNKMVAKKTTVTKSCNNSLFNYFSKKP